MGMWVLIITFGWLSWETPQDVHTKVIEGFFNQDSCRVAASNTTGQKLVLNAFCVEK